MKTKHKMNKISGYYEGPSGVFYDFKNDKIFELIWFGRELYSYKAEFGKIFVLALNEKHVEEKLDKTMISGMSNVIRLGSI